MNTYICDLKLLDPSPKYGCTQRQVKIQSLTIYCAKREIQFQYPDYKLLKVKKVNETSF